MYNIYIYIYCVFVYVCLRSLLMNTCGEGLWSLKQRLV